MPDETRHKHNSDEERKIREAALDETIADTFPASDPPSSIPNPDEEDAVTPGHRDEKRQDERGNKK
jgi:hypothetical protein